MEYNYIAFLFFVIVAILIPFSILLSSKLLRKKEAGNSVKNSPYESGEETIGKLADTTEEYFPYLMIFLPFEIVGVFLLLWAFYARNLTQTINNQVFILALMSAFLAMIGYIIISGKHGESIHD